MKGSPPQNLVTIQKATWKKPQGENMVGHIAQQNNTGTMKAAKLDQLHENIEDRSKVASNKERVARGPNLSGPIITESSTQKRSNISRYNQATQKKDIKMDEIYKDRLNDRDLISIERKNNYAHHINSKYLSDSSQGVNRFKPAQNLPVAQSRTKILFFNRNISRRTQH